MCYGRHTGYGGYGDLTRGGRQILLNEKSLKEEIETWIRLEDGTISAHVTLNSTYGQDPYQAVTNGGMTRPNLHSEGSVLSFFWLYIPLSKLFRW